MTVESTLAAPAVEIPQAEGRTFKARMRSLLTRQLPLAYAGFFASLAALATTVNFAGDVRDGSPQISVSLRSFPSAGEAAAMKVGAFHDTREISGNLVADPNLIEDSPQGPLPKIARDGRTPMSAYGRKFEHDGKKPRIALIVRGLGVSETQTESALAQLLPDVTLGFSPFAPELQKTIDKARGNGHEVLVEVPMEPFDFPDSDPGPHTLRSGQDEDTNIQRLNWALTRFTGYAGVTNLLGQRFLSDSDALAPALSTLNRRGLYFFDNGAAAQSVTPTVAGQVGIPLVQSGPAIDTIQTALEIDRHLFELETQARANGSAVGSAFLYPVSLARITAWAKTLQSRGFVLVPVSAIVSAPKK
jgi:polysaccharide deacetylase 2 family uncharacterized protein YibQ